METITALQGSKEWLAIRAKHFTASEATAMMGASKYMTRDELLKQKHTGIAPEVDANKQFLFDRGHAAEAAARPIVEELIGDELSPITVSLEVEGLPLLASLDGITFDGATVWENKLVNAELVRSIQSGELKPHYFWQLEQALLVTGAKRVIFTASDGTEINTHDLWYESNPDCRAALIAGWKQFAKDLAAYTPPEAIIEVIGKTPESLPALRIEITGMVTASNLAEFKETALAVFNGINTNLQTDQDFADAEKAVKFCKDAEERLDAAKQHALSQTASIDELFRTIDSIKKASSEVRLKLDKLVKSEKENRKAEIVQRTRMLFNDHVLALEAEITPIRILMPMPVFSEAMRNMKKLSAMQDAVDTALRNGMFEADAVAKDIRGKLADYKLTVVTPGYEPLFRDLQTIIYKPVDDFRLVIMTRISQHRASEAAKLEAQRAAIQKEEQEKAEAKLDADRKAMFDAQKKQEEEKADQVDRERKAAIKALGSMDDWPVEPGLSNLKASAASTPKQPTRFDIIEAVAVSFGVDGQTALSWLTNEFQQRAA